VRGDLVYAVPIREICRRLIRCTQEDLGAGQIGDEGGVGTMPEPPPAEPDQETPPAEPPPDADPPPPDGGEQP
jgi:hypothetical protein